MTPILNPSEISKNFAVKIYNQMLQDVCKMNPADSSLKAQEDVIEGAMVGEGQFLIKINTDHFGTVFEYITLNHKKVINYNSYQKFGNKLFKFSDKTSEQYTKLKFYIK
jgi:hypothetical protein